MHHVPEQRGIAEDYMLATAIICVIAFLWIILNEFVVTVANVGAVYSGSTGGEIIDFLILIWRALPVALIIAALVWCVMRAAQREPYAQYGGYY